MISINALEREGFAINPMAWFEAYGKIRDKKVKKKGEPKKPLVCNWLQREYSRAVKWCQEHGIPIRLIVYKPRQKGSSTASIATIYGLSRSHGMNVVILGGQVSQTENMWKMMRYYARHDKFDWGNTFSHDALKVVCSNDTLWERETARDKEAGRSGTYHAVLATELARWQATAQSDPVEVLNSVLNSVPPEAGTIVILESTAQGPVGIFPKTWGEAVTLEQMMAGNNGNGYIKIFAPWHMFSDSRVEFISIKEMETLVARVEKSGDSKALRLWTELGLNKQGLEGLEKLNYYHGLLALPQCGGDPVKRDREYPTTPEDGFQASSPSRFLVSSLDRMDVEATAAGPMIRYGFFERYKTGVVFKTCSRDDPAAEVAMTEGPIYSRSYIVATDNGRGESLTEGGDTDPSAVVCLRPGYLDDQRQWQPPAAICALLPGNRQDMDRIAAITANMADYYGHCMIVPEANMGDLLLAHLKRWNAQLWQRRRKAQEADEWEETGLIGWQTTPASKRFLVDTLAEAIREHGQPYTGLLIPFPWIVRELRTFVRHKDGSLGALKQANCHDDFVISLGIALCCKESATLYAAPAATSFVPEGMSREDLEETSKRVW